MQLKNSRQIDVRGLPPPEPFENIMHALQALPDGAELLVLIHREPSPLYDVMRKGGYTWHSQMLGEDDFRIIISRTP